LSAQLQQETSNKEVAETARMKSEAEARAATEKLALEIKARKAASNSRPASLNHRIAMRRQNQTTALMLATKTRN
jgi:hypothetical protein